MKKTKGLKLYVWEPGTEVMGSYAVALVVVLAHSLAEARQIGFEKSGESFVRSTAPRVFTLETPQAFYTAYRE